MALAPETSSFHIRLDKQADVVRWLPSPMPGDTEKVISLGSWNHDEGRAQIEILSLTISAPGTEDEGGSQPLLRKVASWSSSGRTTALEAFPLDSDRFMLAAGSLQGSVTLVVSNIREALSAGDTAGAGISASLDNLHNGKLSLDVRTDTRQCLTAGEDGTLNAINLGIPEPQPERLYNAQGLYSFSAARWTSTMEFVTAVTGGSMQWWDRRQPNRPVVTLLNPWAATGGSLGSVHSISVHPSRKHLCAVGGSAGQLLVWDLRSPKEPTLLNQAAAAPGLASEIWEVQFDRLLQPSDIAGGGFDAGGKVPAVVACSEDGTLAVYGPGGSAQLLAESCAINTFDIDPEFGQDIICGLDHESLIYLQRARHA